MGEHRNSDDPMVSRALQQIGDPDLVDKLADLSANDLQALLLRVFRERVKQRTAKDVLKTYGGNIYCGVSELSQLEHTRFTEKFLSVAKGRFASVELSPVCPMGSNSVLAQLSQNNVLSAVRGLEAVGDPTTPMVLEAAKRRQAALRQTDDPELRSGTVHLCTDHRLLRLQPFDRSLGYMQHFRCIGMVSAGRRQKDLEAQREAMQRHIQTYLDFVAVLKSSGYALNDVSVLFSDLRLIEQLVATAGVDRAQLTRHTQDPSFHPFEKFSISLPGLIDDPSDISKDAQDQYGIGKVVRAMEDVRNTISQPLERANPSVRFGFDLARTAGIGYYLDASFHIFATNARGLRLQLADGGFTDWTQKALSDNGEFCFVSGFGSELINKMFRP